MPPLTIRKTRRRGSRRCHLTGSLLHRIATLVLTACVPYLSIHPVKQARSAEQPRVPNIILILADDLGYGDVSSYGAKDLKTPKVDALVSAGMRFDNFYANCPVCSPTRASLLSGRYPELVGVPGVIRTRAANNWGYLSPRAVMLPQVLRKAGYHTALVGKWHLGLESPCTPLDRGFDHFHGWLGDMMDDYYKHRRHGINYMRLGRETIDPKGHATDLFTEWAIDYIGSRKDRDEPLELYNLADDPREKVNLAGKNRKMFNELSAALRAQIQRGGAVPWQRPKSP